MRSVGRLALVTGAVVVLATAGVAQAQTGAPAADAQRGYVQVDAAATFGSSSSQSYGGEVGVTVHPGWQLFLEGGRINNVASSAFVTAAQAIAGGLGQAQSGASC